MATITSAASGNFSAGATWVGGVVPGAADIAVVATGHTVVVDTNITVIELQQAGTGKFTVGNGRTITGNIRAVSANTLEVLANSTVVVNGNILGSNTTNASAALTISGANANLTINGSLSGGGSTDRYGMTTAAAATNTTLSITGSLTGGGVNCFALYWGGSGTVTITGDVTGGNNTSAHGIYIGATAGASTWQINGSAYGSQSGSGVALAAATASVPTQTITVTGDVVARASVGISYGSPITLTVQGNVVGGPSSGAHGVLVSGASGSVTVNGNATGGAGADATGLYNSGTSNSVSLTVLGTCTGVGSRGGGVRNLSSLSVTTIHGNTVDGANGASAVAALNVRYMPAVSKSVTFRAPDGSSVVLSSPNIAADAPVPSDVRYGVTYAFAQYTGTLRVPPASSVASGVPVDATTGTAALAPADVAALVGAQIAAALNSTP